MSRTTPDLAGSRQSVYRVVSVSILVGTILYVLWTNYVIFVGGNLPLTSIDLGEGSTGAGLFMLFIGDLIVVLAVWFLVDGVLLNVLHKLLSTGGRRQSTTAQPLQPGQPGQDQPAQAGHPQQWQQQAGPGQWQQGQWQQGQWQQPGPQGQWQQGQPQQGQPQQGQWQQGQWQPAPPPADPSAVPPGGASSGGSSQATLTAQQNRWSPPPER